MNPILQVFATFWQVEYVGYAFCVLLLPCIFFKLLYRRSDR